MCQRMRKMNSPNRVGISLNDQGSSQCGTLQVAQVAHKPVATSKCSCAGIARVTKGEHVQFPLLNDHKDIQPRLVFGSLSCRFPVLFSTQHTFLRPRSSKQCQLFVRDTDGGRIRVFAVNTPVIIFLGFSYDGMRKITSKSKCWRKEGRTGTIHGLGER